MIKINLALKKSAALNSGATSTRMGGTLAFSRISLEDVKDLPNLKGLILLIAVAVAGNMGLEKYKEDELAKLDAVIAGKQDEVNKVRVKLKEMSSLKQLEKQLKDDMVTLQEKYDVITRLGEKRDIPGKILIQISEAIPREVWLSDIQLGSSSGDALGAVSLRGQATSIEQVTEFSRRLQETIYFRTASPRGNTKTTDLSGVEVVDFEMPVERRQ